MLHVVCSLKPVSSQICRVPCRFVRPRILSSFNKLLSSTADYILIDVVKKREEMFSEKTVHQCSFSWISWYWVHRTRLARAGEEQSLSWPRETKPRKISSSSVTCEYESTSRARSAGQTTQQHRARRLSANHKSDLSGVFWDPWADGRETLVRVNLLWVFISGRTTSISKNGVDRIGSRRGQMSCWKRSLGRLAAIWNSDDSSGLSHSDD